MNISKKHFMLGGIIILFSISLTMVLGVPYTGISEEGNDKKGRFYYIHRGIPIAYTGVSVENANLPSHLTSVPFTKFTAPDRSYVKIISIPQMLLLGITSLIEVITVILSLYFFKVIKEKVLTPLLYISGISTIATTVIWWTTHL
jgi:hypothetical protein